MLDYSGYNTLNMAKSRNSELYEMAERGRLLKENKKTVKAAVLGSAGHFLVNTGHKLLSIA